MHGLHPNIKRKERVAIFVFGNCGSGKTTFVNQFLLDRLHNTFAWINADSISLTLTKDETVHNPASLHIAWLRLLSVIGNKQSFIHDTSGYNVDKVAILVDQCKASKFDRVLFYYLDLDMIQVLKNNQARKRNVPTDKIRIFEQDKITTISRLLNLKPTNYILVKNYGSEHYGFTTIDHSVIEELKNRMEPK